MANYMENFNWKLPRINKWWPSQSRLNFYYILIKINILLSIIFVGCSCLDTNKEDQVSLLPSYDLEHARIAWQKENWAECEQLLKNTLGHQPTGDAYLLYAWLKLRQSNWADALHYAREAKIRNPLLVHPYFFEAADQLIQGNYTESLQWFQKIRMLFPDYVWSDDENLGLQTAWWRELQKLREENLPQSGLATTNEALQVFPDQPLFLTMKANFLVNLQHFDEAEVILKSVLEENPYYLPAVQCYRRILFRRGDYISAWKVWQRLVPETLLLDKNNQIQDRYQQLKNIILYNKEYTNDTLWKLARATEEFGWEQEALLVYQKLPDSQQQQKKLIRHLLFLREMQKIIQQNYQVNRLSLVRFLDQISDLAKKYQIPLRPRASQEFDSYFILVREVDPFNPQPGTLAFYLAQYNKILDIGNNYGVIDARLMNRLAWYQYKYKCDQETLDYQIIVGDETYIDNAVGFYSGAPRVAGRTFLSGKGFYLALDTLRPSMPALQKLHKILNADISNLSTTAEKNSIQPIGYNPIIVAKLLRRSFEGMNLPTQPNTSDDWDSFYNALLIKQIDLVHHHELGHIQDFPKFLPMYQNLDNLIKMLWENEFSPQKIHFRFEHTAEIFGLVHCDDPYYYLAQIIERLDVNYSGIFELVYWAWYGKTPQQDPYYQTSLQILQNLCTLSLSSDATYSNYSFLYQISEQEKQKFRDLLKKLTAEF